LLAGFSYASGVSRASFIGCPGSPFVWLALFLGFAVLRPTPAATRSDGAEEKLPLVTKVEPPNWWIHLTPEVMLLLSGRNLDASGVTCNLPELVVQRTQSSAGGNYLFVWLKLGSDLKTGTAVCRITTQAGATSFELPLAARVDAIHRFQGLTSSDVMYLIMPDRFANGDPTNDEPPGSAGSHDRGKARAYHGGDLQGIREHLPYLKELGVNAIWLTPIVKNGAAEDYHGYGAVDLYAVDPHLGTVREYRDLVSAAHEQRIKVVFDIVPNHVGPKHPWVQNPPAPDWFHGTALRHLSSAASVNGTFYGGSENQNHDLFETLADPHAPERLKRELTNGWFFNVLPDMNTENSMVSQYLVQNAIWWAESSGLDAFRVDTLPYVSRQFWSRWTGALRRIYPRLTTIGEVFHPDPVVTSFFVGGRKQFDGVDNGIGTVFDYPLYFVLRDVLLDGAPAGRIADVLRHDSLYPRADELVSFFANHDVTRLAAEKGSSAAKLKLAFALMLTLRGIPEIYYGDEIGMPGGGDPDNRRDFPGGWKEDPKNAFTEAGRTREQQEVFSDVQSLLRLRREHAALGQGRLWHLFSDQASYVFERETEDERIVVVFHNGAGPREFRVAFADTPLQDAVRVTRLFGAGTAELAGKDLRVRVQEPSVSIFSVN
jgi:neopullulanase